LSERDTGDYVHLSIRSASNRYAYLTTAVRFEYDVGLFAENSVYALRTSYRAHGTLHMITGVGAKQNQLRSAGIQNQIAEAGRECRATVQRP
jgi:hypothetical protein